MATLAFAGASLPVQAAPVPAAGPQLKPKAMAQPQRVSQTVDGPDTTPAVLTSFNAAPLVDVGFPGATVVVSLKATDDMAGVQAIEAVALGPNDRVIELSLQLHVPSTKLSTRMFSDQALAFLEPGVYRFTNVRIFDYAFNWRSYDEQDLAALGNITFTLKNNKGFDRTPPTIVSGKVLTPQVSLSADHPGTISGQFAKVTVAVTDAGDGAVAGARSAYAYFCHRTVANACFHMENNSAEAVPMATKATLRLGTQLDSRGLPTGEYEMRSFWVIDYANNWAGGDSDLGAYFPSTTITLVP